MIKQTNIILHQQNSLSIRKDYAQLFMRLCQLIIMSILYLSTILRQSPYTSAQDGYEAVFFFYTAWLYPPSRFLP